MITDNSQQPVVLITGAAGGIGSAAAVAFGKAGYRVAMVDVDPQRLEQAAATVATPTLCLSGDLTDLTFAQQVIDRTAEQWGRLDVLVSNATWRERTTMRQISVESWEKTLRLGLTTPAFMARWAARIMEPQGKGVIINVSSIMANRPSGIAPAYVASKGGLEAITYDLATLYGRHGIRVLGIAPGAIDTPISRDAQPAGTPTDSTDPYDTIPLGRWGQPDEIANLMVYLASDQASYVTGTTVVADGGLSHQFDTYSRKRKEFPEEF